MNKESIDREAENEGRALFQQRIRFTDKPKRLFRKSCRSGLNLNSDKVWNYLWKNAK